jgi:thymidine kinase
VRVVPSRGGWLEVVCGPMFSGKTEELMRRLTRARIAGQSVELVRPLVDTRSPADELVSHAGRRMRSRGLRRPEEFAALRGVDVLGVDEVQFFEGPVAEALDRLAASGVRVVCAGLDMDYRRRPWPVVQELLGRAEFVDKLQAVCLVCGGPATLTQRLDAAGRPAPEDDPTVRIGDSDVYEARCRSCHRIAPATAAGVAGDAPRAGGVGVSR